MNGTVVYISASFPKLSETFVYREVLGLREAGLDVPVVSVRPGEEHLGDEQLDALYHDVIPVYGSGMGRLCKDALSEVFHFPARAAHTLGLAIREVVMEKDIQGLGGRAKVLLQACGSLALANRIRELNPVLLHAHMAHVPTTFARYTAKQLDIPFSFTGHAADIFRDRCLLSVKLRDAAFIHCISHWHREYYQQEASRSEEDLPIIRCGVHVPPEEKKTRKDTGEPLRLFAVGRLVPKKGFDVLLAALADPKLSNGKEWRLVLAGDGPEMARLQCAWSTHPRKNWIEVKGALPNHEVRREMQDADLFVLPCRVDAEGDKDGIPVVLMEAMAAGMAVISGDVPSIRELVEDGVTGSMVSPGDVGDLTDTLVQLLTDASLRNTLAEAGRNRVVDEFSLDTAIERIISNVTRRHLVTP